MASTAVKKNPMKESSNKLTSYTSEKRKAKGAMPSKASTIKNPASSSGRGSGSSKSSRSGKNKKPSSKTRSNGSGSSRSNRDKSKSGSKRKSGSSNSKRKSGSKSGRSAKGSKKGADSIKLSCGTDVYYVSARHFAACSNLIKKELAVNSHARSIDLKQFDKSTVRVLAEYIESKKIKTDISFYSLAELLKFSKVFEMENLRSQLEKFIAVIAGNDLATLHQVLLIIGITTVSRATEREILARAARSFMELASQSTFQRIPFNIVITLFARCDLNVKNEVQVVDAMLLWLAGQANPLSVAPSLFYLVRHDFIHCIQKAFIIERARALRFPEDVIRTIEQCFECRNGTRICVLKEHYEAKYARCGIADASALDAKNPDMPLSLPREAIFYKQPESEAATANKSGSGNRNIHSSQARPYYHAPPACSGKNKKSTGGKSKKGGSAGAKKKGSSTRNSSSLRSKSSDKSSGSQKSSRSKKETKTKTPSKGKKPSAPTKKDKKSGKKLPTTH